MRSRRQAPPSARRNCMIRSRPYCLKADAPTSTRLQAQLICHDAIRFTHACIACHACTQLHTSARCSEHWRPTSSCYRAHFRLHPRDCSATVRSCSLLASPTTHTSFSRSLLVAPSRALAASLIACVLSPCLPLLHATLPHHPNSAPLITRLRAPAFDAPVRRMIRFSLRGRRAEARRNPADRVQSPPGHALPRVAARHANPTLGSFRAEHNALPTRRSDGLAMDYVAYEPSQFYTRTSVTRRRGRTARSQVQEGEETPGLAAQLDLDAASVGRGAGPLSVEKQISDRVAELRKVLAAGEQLGDIDMLKDLVRIHELSVVDCEHGVEKARRQVREVRAITGIEENEVAADGEERRPMIRKVSGKPSKHAASRTISAMKSRVHSRSASKSSARASADKATTGKTPAERASTDQQIYDDKSRRKEHNPHRVGKGISEFGRLSRKSSARLKRLGSAGSILIRRLSKVSVTEDDSTGSSGDSPATSTLEQDTMNRLKTNPLEVIIELEVDLKCRRLAQQAEVDKLLEVQKRLEHRRSLHDKTMSILDQFYGNLPGWNQDPISLRMLPETAEMTEGGLEAERDLANMRVIRERAYAASEDLARGFKAMKSLSTNMSLFVQRLEGFLDSCEFKEDRQGGGGRAVNVDRAAIGNALKDLEKRLKRCLKDASIAKMCSAGASRVEQMKRDLSKLHAGYACEAEVVLAQGALYLMDFAPTLQVAKAGLFDAKLAETFLSELQKLVSEDLDVFDEKVEKFEEHVILERVGILDRYHLRQESRLR